MSIQTITVTGMTCGHCVSSVRDQVGGIPGVTAVDVDLSTGRVTIESDAPVAAAAINDAVAEAGYQVAN
ncbi:heavy-metal-associated domain-containing protein [Mycobacterium sp. 155]|uniref:heavy-metal-associated domain-containing protein n=1 Tax=Mycobacterium sp. 155 TaxID=1157943 RepID=UPI00039A149A|nr:heavy metal-associated domain-containing protein [Mycobacterium sp. 155]